MVLAPMTVVTWLPAAFMAFTCRSRRSYHDASADAENLAEFFDFGRIAKRTCYVEQSVAFAKATEFFGGFADFVESK